ncbi:TIGR01777 family protein, partial [Pseudoxanthomonas sp. SGD-10]
LAGAGIADKRWTDKRKDIIIKSRTESIALLYDLIKRKEHRITSVISASGSGYYSDRGNELLDESAPPNDDFMARCCVLWENAVDEGKALNLRTVKFRTGLVLEKHRGGLPKLALPVKAGLGAALGNGKQWMSWIHIADAVEMYIHAIENESLSGAFNMSSPNPVTNQTLNKAIATVLKKPLWLPNVPEIALKIALGELSTAILGSTKMHVKKIQDTGFSFKYPDIDSALRNIYGGQ